MNLISVEEAIRIAKEFAVDVSLIIGGSLLAVFAIGSLGGGYYRPGQSDIDTLIIIDDMTKFDNNLIEKITKEYQKKYKIPKGFGAIVVNKRELFPPYNKSDELILEIINLKKQGLLLYGNFNVSCIPMPDRKAIIEDANAFEDWRESETAASKSLLSMEACSNSILILLKRYLLIKKDIIEFNKMKVISTYLENEPPTINKEIFQLINNYICSKNYNEQEISEQDLVKMNGFHEDLKLTMNKLLLNR